MNWILLALLAPLLFSISVFIDKFLLSRYFKSGLGALVIFGGLVALPAPVLIFLFKPNVLSIGIFPALLILLNSFLLSSYLFPYYAAIRKSDPSSAIPVFQIIPVFNFFLAFIILGETLTPLQMLAGGIILLGSLGVSIDFKKGIRLKSEVFGLILFAALLISLNSTIFKLFAINLDFWTVSFWQYLGFFIYSIILIVFFKKFRIDLVNSLKKNKKTIITLNIINEIINLVALIIVTYAFLQAPLALVGAINGLGPVFVFLIGLLLSLFLPNLMKEDISIKTIIQKIFFIAIIFIGGYILNSLSF